MKIGRRWLFKYYLPNKGIFWIVRCNLTVLHEHLRCVEFTFGLLGVGVLVQFYYGKRH